MSAPVSASFVDVRGELGTRLMAATRPIPADLSAAELTGIVQVFRDIELSGGGDLNIHSNLPRAIRDYAQELVDGIGADNFVALDPDFPRRISDYLAGLKTPVEELVLLQTNAKWTNYETILVVFPGEVGRETKMSVRDITSKILNHQASVLLHEQDKTHTSPVTRGETEKQETTDECEDFAGYFEALHKIFVVALVEYNKLDEKIKINQTNFELSSGQAKREKRGMETKMEEENKNAKDLTDLGEEHTALHEIVCEQITWCKDFIVSSDADSKRKIDDISREIDRLTKLKNEEEVRRVHLAQWHTHLDSVQTTENADALAFDQEFTNANRRAGQRVSKAEEGVKQAEKFVDKLSTLHSDVKLELEVWHLTTS